MVSVQNWPFFRLFILGNIGQKNVFYDVPEGKNAFLGYKARSSKSQKIAIFRRGLDHGFGLKMGFFPSFYFRQYRPGKCV